MFKVLIVDDEPIIRKGLTNMINWKQLDCEVVGEASDGLEGCDLIRQKLPEIIITDIKMPETNGLEMIREIRNIVPNSKIIILTSYRDFEYIKEAIKLGAYDFILKPSKIEELTAVIDGAVKELKRIKRRNEEFEKLKKLFEQNIPVLREKLLYDVMYDINRNEEDIKEKMQLFNIELDEFVMLVIENELEEKEDHNCDQYEKHLYQFGIINSFDEVFSDMFDVMSVLLNNKRFAFILQKRTDTNEEKEGDNYFNCINDRCIYFQEIISNCFGFTVTVSVSTQGKGIMQLPLKLKECREALERKFYLGENTIVFYNDLNSFFICEDFTIIENCLKTLLDAIKSGNINVVNNTLKDFYKLVENIEENKKGYLKNIYWNTISSINNIRVSILAADKEKKAEKENIDGFYKIIKNCDNISELNWILEEAAIKTAEKVNCYNNKSMKQVVRKTVEYLHANFNKPINLNDMADQAYVSTYYLSRIFKKEMGKNFVDYLNELKIEKAKELLRDERYKTYEVAELVGIQDAHYFSKLFKKHVGMTPTEYRDSHD